MIGQNGILKKVKKAKQENYKAANEEQLRLEINASLMSEKWDGSIANSFHGGTGTESNPYQISNGAELAYFAQNKENYSKFFELTQSINLGNLEFLPIGILLEDESVICFNGHFNGNGFVISNIKINRCENCVGFFRANLGIIENLNLYNVNISGKYAVGGIAAANYEGIIKNCKVIEGNIFATNSYVGGIVGKVYSTNASVENCENRAVVSGIDSVGGVCGVLECGKIIGCTNSWNITSTQTEPFSSPAGGIVGDCYPDIGDCYIDSCVNTKDATVSSSTQGAGGIVGRIYNFDKNVYINNCSNYGSITCKSLRGLGIAGGIVGNMYCGNISNVYNSGTITVGNNDSNERNGGIIGNYKNGIIKKAYNAGKLNGGCYIGAIIGKSFSSNVDIENCYYTNSELLGIGNLNISSIGRIEKVNYMFENLEDFLEWRN